MRGSRTRGASGRPTARRPSASACASTRRSRTACVRRCGIARRSSWSWPTVASSSRSPSPASSRSGRGSCPGVTGSRCSSRTSCANRWPMPYGEPPSATPVEVSLADVRSWARRRTVAEWLALAAGIAVFGYVGWDGALWDARFQLLLHLIGFGAVAGLLAIGLREGRLPSTRLDVPILGIVAAFALATLSAMNLGMSLRAMAVIVAYAAMLPVAILAIERRPGWVGLVTSVPVLALAILTLVGLLARRVEWIVVGAPGLPPIRLAGEGTPFGSVAVPPFVIWPAWALAGLIGPVRLRRLVQTSLVVVGVPLTILSGSRSAWLAIAVTGLAFTIPWGWRRRAELARLRHPGARGIALAVVVVAAAGAGVLLLGARLTEVTSLVYRTALWSDTLRAWSTDRLAGIGPGFMPYARQAAAPDFSFPVRQPHSHNLA